MVALESGDGARLGPSLPALASCAAGAGGVGAGGERLLQLKVDRTGFMGRFSSVLVLDGQKRRIGGVATYQGPDGTTWWSLDREPTLTDPLRTLTFMAPFVARCMIQIG